MLSSETTAPASTDDRAGSRALPYLPVAALAAVVMMLAVARGPIRDIDLYWHVLLGQEILGGTPVAEAGRGWSFAPVADTWVSTQWLSEVLFAKLYDVGGLAAFPVFRTVTTAVALVVLALVTLVRRPARAGVWAFVLAGLQLAFFSQDRSQQFTFVLAPLVGWWAARLWREGKVPPWWIALPLVVVWSNAHGGWVLVPLALGIAGLARVADHGWRDTAYRWAWLLAAGTMVAACVSPSGFGNSLAFLRFSGATSQIGEWAHVSVWNWQALCFVLLLGIVIVSWARGRARPSRGEVVMILLFALFGFIYWRNVTPVCLILAPLVTGILARALGLADPVPAGTRQPFARISCALAVCGAVLAIGVSAIQTPVVEDGTPLGLLHTLHATTAPQRVLNTYNIAGPTLWFAGPPPHVLVGIDGRADRYGAAYIDDYQTTLLGAREGWEKTFDQLRPTAALLSNENALAGVLVHQRGWVEVAREGNYILLHAPGAQGW